MENACMAVIRRHVPTAVAPERVECYAFYTRTEKAFAIVMSSETRQYGNLLLKKGITH